MEQWLKQIIGDILIDSTEIFGFDYGYTFIKRLRTAAIGEEGSEDVINLFNM